MAGRARCRNGGGRAARALGVRSGGILPEAERHPDRPAPRAEQRHGAVDAAAHRDGDAARSGLCAEHLRERARECLDRERLTAHGSGLEQAQAGQGTVQVRRVRREDPVAVDGQSNGGPGVAAGRIPEDVGAHPARLAVALPRLPGCGHA